MYFVYLINFLIAAQIQGLTPSPRYFPEEGFIEYQTEDAGYTEGVYTFATWHYACFERKEYILGVMVEAPELQCEAL